MTYPYISGHCDVANHDHCTGSYAGAVCTCPCHTCQACGQRIERSAA